MRTRSVRWNRVLIVAASGLGLLLVCCIGVWALAPNIRRILQAPFWKTDPQMAAQVARQFIDYELPPDYQELKVLRIQDLDGAVVMAHRERPGDLIHMEAVTEGIIGVEAWRNNYQQGLSREMGLLRYNTQLVGTRATTVRGQPTSLQLFEGTDEAGRRVRQVVCAFKGKRGDMLLAMVAGQDTWDQALVDRFLQSIR